MKRRDWELLISAELDKATSPRQDSEVREALASDGALESFRQEQRDLMLLLRKDVDLDPPASIWENIEARIIETSPLPKAAAAKPRSAWPRWLVPQWTWAAAALSVLLVGALTVVQFQDDGVQEMLSELDAYELEVSGDNPYLPASHFPADKNRNPYENL